MAKGETGESAREQAARAWLETKDRQHAWIRLVGRRIRAIRDETRANEKSPPGADPRWLRTKSEASQQAIAASVARTQSWLSKLERGERSISVGDAYLFARHFDVDPLSIVGPPTEAEQQHLDLDVADIRKAREKAGVIAQKVVERQLKSRTNRRRASTLNAAEEKRKRQC